MKIQQGKLFLKQLETATEKALNKQDCYVSTSVNFDFFRKDAKSVFFKVYKETDIHGGLEFKTIEETLDYLATLC